MRTWHQVQMVAIPYKSGKYSYKKKQKTKMKDVSIVAIPYKSGKYSYLEKAKK